MIPLRSLPRLHLDQDRMTEVLWELLLGQ